MVVTRRASTALLAVLLLLASALPVGALTDVGSGWTYVGSGPMAASTKATATVGYPAAIEPGDVLLLSCQGRRNSMRWSAPGFESAYSYDDQWPMGPSGLRFELLYRIADGTEGSTVTARSTTGVNGWSCAVSAFRGGVSSGRPLAGANAGVISPAKQRLMESSTLSWAPDIGGHLIVHWFVSSDDNNHGRPTYGTLAYGGTGYDTTLGTDHGVSLVYYLAGSELPPHLTMQQQSNGPDAYLSYTVALAPAP